MKLVTGRNTRLAAALAAFVAAAPASAVAETIRLVALGDSLTAGYGLPAADAFPVKLEAALKARGHDVTVANAGVSGDTSSGGLARLDWAVAPDADGVLVELGANDMLRGVNPRDTRRNMEAIVASLRERGHAVLVAGMRAAPNLGPDYERDFNAIFPAVAEANGALLYPFFLDGVAADASLNQPDGIHPTSKGVDIIVERILPKVEELLDRIGSTR